MPAADLWTFPAGSVWPGDVVWHDCEWRLVIGSDRAGPIVRLTFTDGTHALYSVARPLVCA